MRVQVRLSGAMRVVAGSAEVPLDLTDGQTTVGGALNALGAGYPRLRPYLQLDTVSSPQGKDTPVGPLRVLLNDARLNGEEGRAAPLREGDRLTLLTPIAGG
jgi:molybdopterin converting factor small subunit